MIAAVLIAWINAVSRVAVRKWRGKDISGLIIFCMTNICRS